MNQNEDMDRLQERCDEAERMNRVYLSELADYGADMERANLEIADLKKKVLRWKELKP